MARRPLPPGATSLFGDSQPEIKGRPAAFVINIDGGSRGNPGPASYGVVVRNERGDVVAKLKKYIGRATNNVAEYYGLIAALDYAQSSGARALRIESDSELLVRQMRGHYKVKSPDLRPLFERARKMAQTFESFHIDHVYRAQNAEADALANEALDETSGHSKLGHGQGKPLALNPQRKIRARVRDGALHLLEKLDLPEDTEVELVIRPAPKR
jgi:ribonuclease HI